MIKLELNGLTDKYQGESLAINLDEINFLIGDDDSLKESIVKGLFSLYSKNGLDTQIKDYNSEVVNRLSNDIAKESYVELLSYLPADIDLEVPETDSDDEKFKKLFYYLFNSNEKLERFIILNTIKSQYNIDFENELHTSGILLQSEYANMRKEIRQKFATVYSLEKHYISKFKRDLVKEQKMFNINSNDLNTKVIVIDNNVSKINEQYIKDIKSKQNKFELVLNRYEFVSFLENNECLTNDEDFKNKLINVIDEFYKIIDGFEEDPLFRIICNILKNGYLNEHTILILEELDEFNDEKKQYIISEIISLLNEKLRVKIILTAQTYEQSKGITDSLSDKTIEKLNLFKFDSSDEFLYLSFNKDLVKFSESYTMSK